MNRPTKMASAAVLCAALLWACGGDTVSPSNEPDITDTPTPDVSEPVPDVSEEPDAEPDVVPDAQPDAEPEPEPDVVPDVGPPDPPDVVEEVVEGPECVAPIDCINKLRDQLADCETAVCEDNVCAIAPIEDCCLADADCEGYEDACCETITCNVETSQCESEPKEGCCEASYQCNDADPQTNDFCASACEPDGCVFLPPLCDNDISYMTEQFNDPEFSGLVISDTDVFDLVQVSSQKGNTVSPERTLYFGDAECQTYYTGPMDNCLPTDFLAAEGAPVGLEVTTGGVTLAYEEAAYLGFWVRMAAEPALSAGDVIYPTDFLRVSVDTGDGASTVVWRSPDALGVENTTHGEWVYQVVDLTPFKGKPLTFTFSFIADGYNNFNSGDGEVWYGAYVDDMVVRTACVPCVPGSYCSKDFDGCTQDLCTGVHLNPNVGLCTYHAAVLDTECQSCAQAGDCGGDDCVSYDCEEGLCQAAIKPECCQPSSCFPYETLPGGVAVQSFEVVGINFWSVEDPYPDDNIGWQVTDQAGYVGPSSLYFGDPVSGTYVAEPSNPATSAIWSPSFQVSTEVGMPTVLSFWLDLSTEYDLGDGLVDPEDSYDILTVYLHEIGDDPVVVWESASTLGNSTHGTWQQVGIDVTAWANKFVRIGFEFDSKDSPGTGYGNNFGGVYIDELTVSVYCESECLTSEVCDDGDSCTTNACVFGACETTQPDPDCCHVDSDCSHDNSCVDTECLDGQCQYSYSQLGSCCSEGAWLNGNSSDFEGGSGEWTTIDSTPPVIWSVTNNAAHSGFKSYNFADPETGLYAHEVYDSELGVDLGQQTTGRLISPTVTVPPFNSGNPFAEFWLKMETEWDFGDPAVFEPAIPVDELRVFVATEGNIVGAAELWTSHYLLNTTKGEWAHTYVDLTDYRGEDVQLIFEFVSGDGNFNDFSGAFVDDVSFGTTCKAPAVIQCFDGGDCLNNDECVAVACTQDFTCAYSAVDSPQCCEPTDMSDLAQTFEEGELAWEFTACDEAETAPGIPVDPSSSWKIADESATGGIDAKYGAGMLYFGNGFDYGGAAGTASCGRAVSQPITIEDSDVDWMLTYWAYMDIEPATDCDQGFGAPWLDVFTLEILEEETGDSTLILVKDELLCSDYGNWAHQMWDMTPWVGSTIRFRVGFNSWDQDANNGKGIALDEFRFERGCPEF